MRACCLPRRSTCSTRSCKRPESSAKGATRRRGSSWRVSKPPCRLRRTKPAPRSQPQAQMLAAVRSGQLHLAYEEGQAALNLIEHMKGFALLKGYFEIALAQVCYQWNRLEEARDLLRMVVHNAAAWQQLELLAWGYADLIQAELARRDRPAAQQALHEVEQLVQRERFGIYPGWLPTMQAHCWLAQGQLEAASKWAASVVFPGGAWEGHLYNAFPVVIRGDFAYHG